MRKEKGQLKQDYVSNDFTYIGDVEEKERHLDAHIKDIQFNLD